MNQPEVIVYTRDGCHLCDEAIAVLDRFGVSFVEIDIDKNPDLKACYDTCVPVVKISGTVRFRGRVNPLLLRRILVRHGGNDESPGGDG